MSGMWAKTVYNRVRELTWNDPLASCILSHYSQQHKTGKKTFSMTYLWPLSISPIVPWHLSNSVTFSWLLSNSLTFPWPFSNSPTFPWPLSNFPSPFGELTSPITYKIHVFSLINQSEILRKWRTIFCYCCHLVKRRMCLFTNSARPSVRLLPHPQEPHTPHPLSAFCPFGLGNPENNPSHAIMKRVALVLYLNETMGVRKGYGKGVLPPMAAW